jgi:hypothetical protein
LMTRKLCLKFPISRCHTETVVIEHEE